MCGGGGERERGLRVLPNDCPSIAELLSVALLDEKPKSTESMGPKGP